MAAPAPDRIATTSRRADAALGVQPTVQACAAEPRKGRLAGDEGQSSMRCSTLRWWLMRWLMF
jgi:hypothetical protein